MKWWKERNEKEKKEIINQFKQLKHNDFEKWLLNDSKWKDNLKQENLSAIRGAIEAYIIYFPSEEKISIYLKELTLNELFRQCCYYLDEKGFTKLSKMKMDVVDMNDNMIESDEDVMRVLKLKDPTFKLTWTHSGEKKIIRNALVMMIAISEYNEGLEWESLKNVKDKDITNFKKLFEEELKYDF
ncbi:hypothetical protein RFI_40295, partial [Reticulomyxa filosa]